MKKNVYSVTQVNGYIKNLFSQDFALRQISIKGEVSNCKYHTSGHVYFTLKDEKSAISVILFAGNRKGLDFRMQEGNQVIVTGMVDVYERDGKYQLYAKEIVRDGVGNLYLAFEKLKQTLEEMGMFAPEYKKRIPAFASRIGIVTAPTGAAIQDIRNIAGRRNPFVQLILYPAQVQGEGAAESIVRGIYALEALQVDVIIIGRGGGSIEDLWAFNEESVARAIFDCTIPVISAVGHETDWTIADFVADMRAPTPSAAAELAVFDYLQVLQFIRQKSNQLDSLMQQKLSFEMQRLALLQAKLDGKNPTHQLNEHRQRLVELEHRMQLRMETILRDKRHQLELYAGQLSANSPVNKLSRGYVYAEHEGRALTSVSQVQKKDEIQVYLLDGLVRASVTEVSKSGQRDDDIGRTF